MALVERWLMHGTSSVLEFVDNAKARKMVVMFWLYRKWHQSGEVDIVVKTYEGPTRLKVAARWTAKRGGGASPSDAIGQNEILSQAEALWNASILLYVLLHGPQCVVIFFRIDSLREMGAFMCGQ